MTTNIKLKEAYDVESKHGAFYTGGNIEWHSDVFYCQGLSSISLLNITQGTVIQTIGDEAPDADEIYAFTTDTTRTITAHKSGLFKLWDGEGAVTKMWKVIHKGPVTKIKLHGSFLVSGGADGSIRKWDLEHHMCVLHLKNCQGVVNVVEVNAEDVVFGSGDDGVLYSWDFNTGRSVFEYKGHYSKVTSVVFAHNGCNFVSCGRDKMLILWEYGSGTALRIIPMYEAIEVLSSLPVKFKIPDFKSNPEAVYVASGGELGVVRVWDVTNAKEIYKQENSLISKAEEGSLAMTQLLLSPDQKMFAVISKDHNILLYYLKSFACYKQFVGFSDEILDLTFVGKNDSHLAVATNSADIKLYENATMNCQILKGHSDIVLSLATSASNPAMMLSGSKDNKVRLWELNSLCVMVCLGVGLGHTGSVGSVAIAHSGSTFVTASQDTCLKLWGTPEDTKGDSLLCCVCTIIAHDKDINSVSISPNDKIIATASQDKTIKLWNESLSSMGCLKGHKRGVWCVKFSPVDQVILSSSADATIKLWSVTSLSCLKTLEGHDSSVLNAAFISNGMQIVSSGGDGLIKIFNLKSSECTGTFEHHNGKIWALAVSSNESQIVSGGSDSLLIKWKDVTHERKQERQQQEEVEMLQQQKLQNYLQNDQLVKALKLALKLERPLQVLKIIQSIMKKQELAPLADTVQNLKNQEKQTLLEYVITWNTNSRNSQVAQVVLNILIGELQNGGFKATGVGSLIENSLPYTERHFKRVTQLLQNLYFLNYTISCMQSYTE